MILIGSVLRAGTFVHETPVEFTSSGDFNGDAFPDILLIDKATGLYRIGYGTATPSVFNFAEGRASGVTGVTGVAVGKLNGVTSDSFAVTAPAENRANILSPATTGYTEPKPALDAGLGPVLLAALDIPGGAAPTAEDDLGVVESLDLANQFQLRQLRSNAGTWSLLRSDDVPDASCSGGNPIIPHSGSPALMAFIRDDGGTSSFHAWDLTGASATEVLAATGLTKGSHFTCGLFGGANADVMTWVPGQAIVLVGRIVVVAPYAFSSSSTYTFSQGIAQLVPVNGPAGLGVLVRYTSGDVELRAYTLATGFSSPLAITPSGTSGTLSGVVPMPGNAFQLLYSATPGGPTSSVVTFENNGSGWTQTGISNVPALKPMSRFANVFLLEQPLFRGDEISVLRSYKAADWVTSVSESGAGPFSIIANAASFGTSTQGVGTPSPTTVGSVTVSPGGVAMNQLHPQFSIASFATHLGPAVDAVSILPAPGTYANAQQITFSGVLSGTTVYYRMNGGAFTAWNPASPPWITRPTTIDYYASRSSGASPTLHVEYKFSLPPALQDNDGDGAPDFVELAYGMDPAGGDDADGDGYGDLDELAAGTNPNDDTSVPATDAAALDAMLVDVRMQLRNVNATLLANSAAGAPFEIFDAFDHRMAGGVVGTGAPDLTFGRATVRGVHPILSFLVVRSAPNFSTTPAETNEPRGREMLGILPALEPESWSWSTTDGTSSAGTIWSWGGTNFQPGSTNWNAGTGETQGADPSWSTQQLDPLWDSAPTGLYSAAGWVAKLQGAANRGAQPYARISLSPASSLGAVIFGHVLTQLLADRVFSVEPIDGTDLVFESVFLEHLWRLRRPDAEFSELPAARIVGLIRHIDTQLNAGDAGSTALRKLARDFYSQHQSLAADHLDDLPTPLAALAEYVTTGLVPTAYQTGSTLTPSEITAALARLNTIISTSPTRTAVTQTLYVRSLPSPPGLSLLQNSGGTAYLLLDKDLHPLALPSLAEAPAGTAIEVTGYADMPVVGGYSAIEVLQISLESLPFNVGEDTDGDLLADVWELRHFGTLAYDGAANEDGSAYSLAQEYLEGTDPTSSSHSPPVGPQALRFMHFELFNGPPSPQLRALWPERYASAVDVLFESSTDLLNWNILPALPATDAGSGWFTRGIAFDAPRKFFQPKVKLKR